MKKRNILIAQWESEISGSPESAKYLIEVLLNNNWNVHVVVGHNGQYVKTYEQMGCEVTIIPQKHWLSSNRIQWYIKTFLLRLKAIYLFTKLIKLFSPNIVYINTIVGIEVSLAAKFNGIPVIWHIRDMYNDVGGDLCAPRLIGKRGVANIISYLSKQVITVSNAVRDNVFFKDHKNIQTIYNGIDDKFKPIEYKRSEKTFTIGVPGTLRPMKGHEFLLKSIIDIAPELIPFKILITGTGSKDYKNLLLKYSNNPFLRNNVTFIGNVRKMNVFLNICNIVIIPSSCDPLPRTVMESMAAGRPIIATNVGGIPEMIDHDVNGYLVEYGNKLMLNNYILKLKNKLQVCKSFSISSERKAKNLFKMNIYQSKLLTVINTHSK